MWMKIRTALSVAGDSDMIGSRGRQKSWETQEI
jgi:hypothetical protein